MSVFVLGQLGFTYGAHLTLGSCTAFFFIHSFCQLAACDSVYNGGIICFCKYVHLFAICIVKTIMD